MPRIANAKPNVRRRNDAPVARATKTGILSSTADVEIFAGTPIGLLMALTYPADFAIPGDVIFKSDTPKARII